MSGTLLVERFLSLRRYGLTDQQIAEMLTHIEIAVTERCNLSCPNCNRSSGKQYAPSNQHMSAEEIARFVNDSIHLGILWRRIRLLGGEPTLHPQIDEIVEELHRYKRWYNDCFLTLTTNNYSKRTHQVLKRLKGKIHITKTPKTPTSYPRFVPYHIAPLDVGRFDPQHITVCEFPWACGMALSSDGYYPCSAGSGVDRVFKMDLGAKCLEDVSPESFAKVFEMACGYCGHYLDLELTKKPRMTESWKKVFVK